MKWSVIGHFSMNIRLLTDVDIIQEEIVFLIVRKDIARKMLGYLVGNQRPNNII